MTDQLQWDYYCEGGQAINHTQEVWDYGLVQQSGAMEQVLGIDLLLSFPVIFIFFVVICVIMTKIFDKKKLHPFHLVDPSPWPWMGGSGAFLLTVGITMYFHYSQIWCASWGVTPAMLWAMGFVFTIYPSFYTTLKLTSR